MDDKTLSRTFYEKYSVQLEPIDGGNRGHVFRGIFADAKDQEARAANFDKVYAELGNNHQQKLCRVLNENTLCSIHVKRVILQAMGGPLKLLPNLYGILNQRELPGTYYAWNESEPNSERRDRMERFLRSDAVSMVLDNVIFPTDEEGEIVFAEESGDLVLINEQDLQVRKGKNETKVDVLRIINKYCEATIHYRAAELQKKLKKACLDFMISWEKSFRSRFRKSKKSKPPPGITRPRASSVRRLAPWALALFDPENQMDSDPIEQRVHCVFQRIFDLLYVDKNSTGAAAAENLKEILKYIENLSPLKIDATSFLIACADRDQENIMEEHCNQEMARRLYTVCHFCKREIAKLLTFFENDKVSRLPVNTGTVVPECESLFESLDIFGPEHDLRSQICTEDFMDAVLFHYCRDYVDQKFEADPAEIEAVRQHIASLQFQGSVPSGVKLVKGTKHPRSKKNSQTIRRWHCVHKNREAKCKWVCQEVQEHRDDGRDITFFRIGAVPHNHEVGGTIEFGSHGLPIEAKALFTSPSMTARDMIQRCHKAGIAMRSPQRRKVASFCQYKKRVQARLGLEPGTHSNDWGAVFQKLESIHRDRIRNFNEHSTFLLGDRFQTAENEDGKEGYRRLIAVISTENLLLNGLRQWNYGEDLVIQIDTTWRVTTEGYGLLPVLVVSPNQEGKLVAIAIISHEDADAHVFVYERIMESMEELRQRRLSRGDTMC